MVVGLGVLCVLAAVAWLYLLVGHGEFWRTTQRLPVAHGDLKDWPDVVAVIPARNEAEMLPLTLPTLLDQDYPGSFRVVLVDDCSDDGTGEIAAGLDAARVRVVHGKPRPDGWAGKVWAMAQGLAAAQDDTAQDDTAQDDTAQEDTAHQDTAQEDTAQEDTAHQDTAQATEPEYLLFTDADIAWGKGTLTRLVTAAVNDDRDLVSQMARLRTSTAWERAIVPALTRG